MYRLAASHLTVMVPIVLTRVLILMTWLLVKAVRSALRIPQLIIMMG